MVECGNCRDRCGSDEIADFDLPEVGTVWLCLDCGPEENYADLRRAA